MSQSCWTNVPFTHPSIHPPSALSLLGKLSVCKYLWITLNLHWITALYHTVQVISWVNHWISYAVLLYVIQQILTLGGNLWNKRARRVSHPGDLISQCSRWLHLFKGNVDVGKLWFKYQKKQQSIISVSLLPLRQVWDFLHCIKILNVSRGKRKVIIIHQMAHYPELTEALCHFYSNLFVVCCTVYIF